MFQHPKTTITGILSILMSVGSLAIAWLSGHPIGEAELTAVLAGITTGVGLITAADATPKA